MTRRVPEEGRTSSRPQFGWQEDATCRDLSLDLFFGPDGERPTVRRERERRALAVCAGCPVVDACLEHALTLPENHGVWGGTSEHDRAERRRRQRVA